MRDIDLFQMALGLTPPWQVSDAEFNLKKKRLDIRIDFPGEAPLPALGVVSQA
jgi:hypothetical protein